MPDIFPESMVWPRRPTKGDYVNVRRFRQALSLPCRLWLAGHRGGIPTDLALRALNGKGTSR